MHLQRKQLFLLDSLCSQGDGLAGEGWGGLISWWADLAMGE